MPDQKLRAQTSDPSETTRSSTGVTGLDEILGGGLPRECFYLIQGDPGSGKTTLALQFLLEGLRQGETGFYITLSETREELLRVAQSHGWSLDGLSLLEMSAIESILRPEAQTTVFHPAEVELNEMSQLLLGEVLKKRPQRLVFDSLSEFRLIAETPLRYRRQLLNLKREFAQCHSTVLLLDDNTGAKGEDGAADPQILSLTHGVLEMEELSPDYGKSRRRLRIRKMRGVQFSEGYHDYLIAHGGLQVFPRLTGPSGHSQLELERVSSGLPELDQLLGGGLERGTTSLILGAAGTGKSTLALQYATQVAGGGERAAVFAFDESRSLMVKRSRELGLRVPEQLENGSISIDHVDPAELSPGEFAVRVAQTAKNGARLVVIDSLNGYLNAMPAEKYLNSQLHELCSFLNDRGVLTILILAQYGLVTSVVDAPVDLSYLADTVISMRFFEVAGEVKQALAVIKKRGGRHEKSIREIKLETGHGIRIGPLLTHFQGVLSGTPIYLGAAQEIMRPFNADR